MTSGFGVPIPILTELFDIPLDEKDATFSKLADNDPTPTTLAMFPGLSADPCVGPSLPIADITITPAVVSSSILVKNGRSYVSLLAVDKFTISISFSRMKSNASKNHAEYVISSSVNNFKM